MTLRARRPRGFTLIEILLATALLVGGLAWLLPRRLRFLAPVTFVITAVPLALFMFTSVNPSGWATLSAGVLWLAVYGAYEAVGWRQPAVLGVALVAAVMGSGARADAALFSVLGVGLALGLRLRLRAGASAAARGQGGDSAHGESARGIRRSSHDFPAAGDHSSLPPAASIGDGSR